MEVYSISVSAFNNIWDTDNNDQRKNYDVERLFGIIKTGDCGVAGKIIAVRNAMSKEERDKLKSQLQVVMWQGLFTNRSNNGCISLSGLLCIDIDHQDENTLDGIRQTISGWPYVLSYFRSPSGDGLKVIVLTDNFDVGNYSNCYRQVEKLFHDAFEIKVDQSCEDVSHACYISYDPDIYVNWNAAPWHYLYDSAFDKQKKFQSQSSSGGSVKPISAQTNNFMVQMQKALCPLTDDQIIDILDIRWSRYPQNYQDGHRTKSIFVQAQKLCLAGIDEQTAIDYLKTKFIPTGYDKIKLSHEADKAYQKTQHLFGSERHMYKSYPEYKRNH